MISQPKNRLVLTVALLSFATSLIAQDQKGSAPKKPTQPEPAEPMQDSDGKEETTMTGKMDNQRLGSLIKEFADEIEGLPGRWQFKLFEIQMICLTDEDADRMRIMSPIIPTDKLTPEQMIECMHANFDRALDARYCINDGIVWSTFIHPLGDLTPELLKSAVLQVAGAKINFGTTYASGGLQFGGGKNDGAEDEATPKSKYPEA